MERRRAHTQQLQLITPMTSENLSFAADVAHRAPDTSSYRARVGDLGSNMAHGVSCHLLLCLSNKKAKTVSTCSCYFEFFLLTSHDGNKGHRTIYFGCLVSVLLGNSLRNRNGPNKILIHIALYSTCCSRLFCCFCPFNEDRKIAWCRKLLVTPG